MAALTHASVWSAAPAESKCVCEHMVPLIEAIGKVVCVSRDNTNHHDWLGFFYYYDSEGVEAQVHVVKKESWGWNGDREEKKKSAHREVVEGRKHKYCKQQKGEDR